MGGHQAWRKRLETGETAKQYAGAIARHRPHLGRKGKDLIKNRKGNIGGGNPKKRKKMNKGNNVRMEKNDRLGDVKEHGEAGSDTERPIGSRGVFHHESTGKAVIGGAMGLVALVVFYLYFYNNNG